MSDPILSEHVHQIDQTQDQAVMPIMIQREKLKTRIRNNLIRILMCDLRKLSANVVLELQRDLKEWYK